MYYIGIDIGLEETTVSRVPGYNGAPLSQIAICRANTAIYNNDGGNWSLVYGSQDYKL